jgi:hypothetical protein
MSICWSAHSSITGSLVLLTVVSHYVHDQEESSTTSWYFPPIVCHAQHMCRVRYATIASSISSVHIALPSFIEVHRDLCLASALSHEPGVENLNTPHADAKG